MSVVLFLQIDQFSADIADRTAFVGHVAHCHIAEHRDMSVSILNDMEIAIQQSGHLWQIVGQDGAYLTEIDFVQRNGDILQGCGVAIL